MAKVTDQSVPPELASAFWKLATKAAATQGATGVVTTSKAATVATTTKKARSASYDADRIVSWLAAAWGMEGGGPSEASWRSARKSELRAGTLGAPWLIEATKIWSKRLKVTGSGTEQLPRPNYEYATAQNRPTVTTWDAPVETTDDLQYRGSLHGALFVDDVWVYEATEFSIPAPAGAGAETPALVIIDADIVADADRRGSRPMFSLMTSLKAVPLPLAPNDVAPPPLAPAVSHYWPFAVPLGVAPYYHATMHRIVSALATHTPETAKSTVVRLTYGLRPMLGHANNNNTSVQTTMTATAKVYTTPPPRPDATRFLVRHISLARYQWYQVSVATHAMTPWRRFDDQTVQVLQGINNYIMRVGTQPRYIADRFMRSISQFEQDDAGIAASLLPFQTYAGYRAHGIVTVEGDELPYTANWASDGSLLSLVQADPPAAHRAQDPSGFAVTSRGMCLSATAYPWCILDADENVVAELDLDSDAYYAVYWAFAVGDVIYVAFWNDDVDGTLFYVDTAALSPGAAETPPVVAPTRWMDGYFEYWQFAVLGDRFALRAEGAAVRLYDASRTLLAQVPLSDQYELLPVPISVPLTP